MPVLPLASKPFIIGIMGSHRDDAPLMEEAERLAREIAKRGYVLLTGGGTGIMRAASRGAHLAGGLVIGILPNDRTRPLSGYPNEFVDIPIYTGMYEARNVINAKSPHVIVAFPGGAGTLSEIALALRAHTPVITIKSRYVDTETGQDIIAADTVEEVLDAIEGLRQSMNGSESP